MSATKRVISESMAGWVSIIVVVLNKLVLVPIFLANWTIDEYGVWGCCYKIWVCGDA